MLSTLHKQPDSPPVSRDLAEFLISCTPGKLIGLTTIDSNHIKNGTSREMVSSYLTEQEKSQLDTYTFEKRRQEWLLGRICAKQSVLDLLSNASGSDQLTPLDIAIEVAPSGRPFVKPGPIGSTLPIPDISISHSNRKIIALAANGHCGIDIQVITETLFKVQSRFCSAQENSLLHTAIDDDLVQLGLLWVAKEAVRKCFGSFRTIGFMAMELTEVNHTESCSFLELQLDRHCAGTDVVTVAASVEDDYCLGACIVPREIDDA